MSRYTTMTLGFLLVLLGIKFHMVESYLLTQNATQFWMDRVEDPASAPDPNSGFSPVNQIADRYTNTQRNFSNPYRANSYQPYPGGGIGSSGFGSQNSSVFQNASYQTSFQQAAAVPPLAEVNRFWPQKQLSTPRWLGWPVLFLGTVFILHGAVMRKS